MVDKVLRCWVREGESERQIIQIFLSVMSLDKLLEAVGNVLPQLIGIASLQLFWHPVLGLDDIEFGLLIGQSDLANS